MMCFLFSFPSNHNEPTNHLAPSTLKNMCTYILSLCFLSVVLSALSQRQLFWSLYDCFPSVITLDLEYLIQKFAINGAFSSPKNNVCFFDFYCFDSETFPPALNIQQMFFVVFFLLWNMSAVIVSSQLGSLFPAHCACDVAWRVIQGEKYLCGKWCR